MIQEQICQEENRSQQCAKLKFITTAQSCYYTTLKLSFVTKSNNLSFVIHMNLMTFEG